MATYNGAGFIAEQLDSFAKQTVLPSELVITDDGSTDATLRIAAEFAASAPFTVRIEKNHERLGFKANFMKAVSLCRSDVIALSDQDDVWLPQKLETCLPLFSEDDVLMAFHNATVVTETLEPIGRLDRAAAPQAINPPLSIDPYPYVSGITLIFRRELVSFNDLWAQSFDFHKDSEPEGHDHWFLFLASYLGTVRYVPDPLALYRQHGANACGWHDTAGIRRRLDNLLATDLDGFRLRELAAKARASILEQIKHRLSSDDAFLDEGIAGFRVLEARYRLRQEMYRTAGGLRRAWQIAALLRSGGYRPRQNWGVGREAFIRDVLCNLCIPSKDRSGMPIMALPSKLR